MDQQQGDEVWLVQLASGAVRAMTLDELDAAFQAATIDEDTLLRRDDATTWSRLRDELGLDEPVVATSTPSTPPVVFEVKEDRELEFESPFKKSRKRVYAIGGAIAAVTLAVAIFGATKLGADANSTSANIANANATQPPSVTPSDPQPQAASTALTEEQKKALAEKDAQHNQKMEKLRQNRAKNTVPETHPNTPPPFGKSGSEHDPLNAGL